MKKSSFFKAHPFYADLMLAVLISIIALILIMLGLRFFTHHGKEYEVPDFSDYNIEQIERYAKDSNQYDFQLTINDSVFEPTKKGGIVISQDPQAGMNVKKGRKIYLTLSMLVPPQVEMPNLIDLSLRQAVNMLESNDLTLGQVIYKESKYPNAVLEQRYKGRIIQEGKKVPYQSKITLIVGKETNYGEVFDETEIIP
ncbi:MAG: PASTA domain-containing protein [Bacteroidales bacterium]|jgi:beta-lactam-binding protein with PASTA domain|nr:PASTA domain-containing protein [Bacteroidales bacterium]MDD3691589.1 PASTA domain-containing protein [Bacteroidales bacterium]MDD4581589.1 PASTA domain-containing protein [Bacteroidales bacterium]NLO42808.1 PASTA domain-containing protein [Bacteroidales bacterium]